MTTGEQINEERRRYLQSGRTRRDWVRYVVAIESIRRRPDGPGAPDTHPSTGTPGWPARSALTAPPAFASAPPLIAAPA